MKYKAELLSIYELMGKLIGKIDNDDDNRKELIMQNSNLSKNGDIIDFTKFQRLIPTTKTKKLELKNEANQNLTSKGDNDLLYLKEGSIRKRKRGNSYIWEARYYYNGKQCSVYSKNQEKCKQKLNAALKECTAGINVPKVQQYTLHTWLWHWFETYKNTPSAALSKSHLASIKICIKKHIQGNISDISIKKVTSEDLQICLNKIESSKMRKETFNVLNEAFRKASTRSINIVKYNLVEDLEKCKHETINGKPLTLDEEKYFFESLQLAPYLEFKNYYLFLRFTGARPGEGMLAEYEDIDLKKEVLFIRGTKTKAARRNIPISSPLKVILEHIAPLSGKLFNFTYKAAEAAFKTMLPRHTLKDLRHTFATRCYESGIQMKTVQVWLGHTRLQTTEKIYTTVLDDFNKIEAKKVQSLFFYSD